TAGGDCRRPALRLPPGYRQGPGSRPPAGIEEGDGDALMTFEIDSNRLRRLFLELVNFNSPPGQEAEVSAWCAETLRGAGFETRHDDAGNLIARKTGSVAGAPPVFFSGHVDTVQPTEGLVVREVDGVFRTGGTTILGADDKAAVAEILEAMRRLHEMGEAHGDLQVVLSVKEEVGLGGARALAPETIAGSLGFVFDASGAPGRIISSAPSHEHLYLRFRGRAAHSGIDPEDGVSAIEAAARAIASMRLGRVDGETTANVGLIQGGKARNIVPDDVHVHAEARSRDDRKLAA